MIGLKNCRKCHTIFSISDSNDTVFCGKCEIEEEKQYKTIRDYLYDNPGTNVYDLSLKFNISIRRIEEYIRNGRITVH